MNYKLPTTSYPNRRNTPKSTGPHSQKVLEIPSITLFLFALVALWLKNPFNQRNLCHRYPRLKKFSSCLFSFLYICRESSTNHPFLCKTNPILSAVGGLQMNVTSLITVVYENIANWTLGENKPNTNPIKANFQRAQMNVNSLITKDYRKKDDFAVQKNKPNSNPISVKPKMNITYFITKDYKNERLCRRRENKPKTKPISNSKRIYP